MAELWQRIAGLSPAKQQLLRQALARRATAMSVAQLEVEARLDPAIVPRADSDFVDLDPLRVFVTGATGFLGAFIVAELLRQTRADLVCLVRATSIDAARAKLRANLQQHGVWQPAYEHRLTLVPGDLSQPRFGLAEDAFRRLAEQVDAIYHCAALVNWIYPFASLRDVNVGGTHEALRLAAMDRARPFHFISTVGVFSSPDFGSDAVAEDAPLHDSGALHVGYAQSKWVAERLVGLAAERGLPTTIVRPAVAPHSVSGIFKETDHVCRLIKGCIQLRKAPALEMRVDLAPVDYVAAATVALSRQASSIGRTFHLVNPVDLTWAEAVGIIRKVGYQVDLVPYSQWKQALLSDTVTLRSNALFTLSPLLSEALIENAHLPRFETHRTLDALRGSGIQCPPMDAELLECYLRHFAAVGFVPPISGSPVARS